jgi:phosphate starvation-inducible protein PhoH
VQEPVKKSTRRKTTYKNADNKTVSELLPKTENQKAYIDAIDAYDQVIVLGPAGTGKTYIAATYAANLYTVKAIDKIIITRPNVAAGKSIGYFPGTLEEKMMPWVMPVLEVLHWNLGKGAVECIDYIEDFLNDDEYIGYLRGNVAKYLHRWRYKNGIEDLNKAQWYLTELINYEQNK